MDPVSFFIWNIMLINRSLGDGSNMVVMCSKKSAIF